MDSSYSDETTELYQGQIKNYVVGELIKKTTGTKFLDDTNVVTISGKQYKPITEWQSQIGFADYNEISYYNNNGLLPDWSRQYVRVSRSGWMGIAARLLGNCVNKKWSLVMQISHFATYGMTDIDTSATLSYLYHCICNKQMPTLKNDNIIKLYEGTPYTNDTMANLYNKIYTFDENSLQTDGSGTSIRWNLINNGSELMREHLPNYGVVYSSNPLIFVKLNGEYSIGDIITTPWACSYWIGGSSIDGTSNYRWQTKIQIQHTLKPNSPTFNFYDNEGIKRTTAGLYLYDNSGTKHNISSGYFYDNAGTRYNIL